MAGRRSPTTAPPRRAEDADVWRPGRWLVPSAFPQAPLRVRVLVVLLAAGSSATALVAVLTDGSTWPLLMAFVGWFAYGNLSRLEAVPRPHLARNRWNLRPAAASLANVVSGLIVAVVGYVAARALGATAVAVWIFAGFVISAEIGERVDGVVRLRRARGALDQR